MNEQATQVKYTPGPWVAEPVKAGGHYDIRQRPAFRPAKVWDTGLSGETLANARLVAAAPELLEALIALADITEQGIGPVPAVDDDWDADHGALAEAQRVITLATGGAS